MTETEILGGNKLICVFMGGFVEGDSFWMGDDANEYPDEIKYHKSWNWLMPVWYQFKDLKFEEETARKLHLNYVARLAQDLAYGTIEEFFHNIGIAIKWYDNQSKN